MFDTEEKRRLYVLYLLLEHEFDPPHGTWQNVAEQMPVGYRQVMNYRQFWEDVRDEVEENLLARP